MTVSSPQHPASSTDELGSAPRRGGWRRHRWYLAAAGVVLLGLAVFVAVWFQPQKLIIDDAVDEALPTIAAPAATPTTTPAPTTTAALTASTASTATSTAPTTTAPALVAERRGGFRSLEHGTNGDAVVYRLPDGTRVLRLEELDTSNGPDLRVILSSVAESAGMHDFGEEYVELGRLKGNKGSQNYDIPAEVDLDRFGRVVIWCARFSVGFGVAGLV